MIARIRAFFEAVRTVLAVIRQLVVNPVRARGRVFWRDLQNWLDNHDLTMAGLIGNILATLGGAMLGGCLIAVAGLSFGTSVDGSESWARAIVLIGMVIGLLGFLPIALFFLLARRLFDLVFHTARISTEVLREQQGDIPDRLRQQLEALREAQFFPVSVSTLLTCYLGAFMVMCMFPTWSSVMYVIIAASFGYITFHLRDRMGIKGWALSHFLYSLAMAFMWFATPAYFLARWINGHNMVVRLYPDPMYAFFMQLGFAALVMIIACVPLYRTTHSNTSDEALDHGDVQRKEFKKRTARLDGQGRPVYELVKPKSHSKLWLALAAIALVAYVHFFGNPLSGIGPIKLVAYTMTACVAAGIGLAIYNALSTEEAQNE